MKALLLEILSDDKRCVNKDLAGGMGTKDWIGNTLRARIFEQTKKRNVVLPHLAIAYLSAIFSNNGWEVQIAEVRGLDVPTESFDLILAPTSIVDSNHELEVIKKLKNKDAYIGVYGAFASAMPEFFSSAADFVICGEVEATALEIAKSNQLPKGIIQAKAIDDLNALPFPDWSKFPIHKYSYSPAINKKPVVTMLASRGCPYSCAFYCPYPIVSGQVFRARSPENVLAEIDYLVEDYKIKAIDFRDMTFTMNKDRAMEIAKAIQGRSYNIIWSCETRLDRLDKDLIKEMHKAGLRNLNVGIESLSEEILKKSKRLPVELEHQEELIAYCNKLGINVAAFYIIGLEDDTEESILATIKYAKKLNTLVARFAISTPFPGTTYFDELKDNKRLLASSWEDYNSFDLVFKHKNLSREKLLKLKEKAHVEYYFRPAYIRKHVPKFILEKLLWQS